MSTSRNSPSVIYLTVAEYRELHPDPLVKNTLPRGLAFAEYDFEDSNGQIQSHATAVDEECALPYTDAAGRFVPLDIHEVHVCPCADPGLRPFVDYETRLREHLQDPSAQIECKYLQVCREGWANADTRAQVERLFKYGEVEEVDHRTPEDSVSE